MRRRPAALILAVLVALTTLALKRQHASLPTLGLADQAARDGIFAATAPTVNLVIVLITAEGREEVVRSGRPLRKVRRGLRPANSTWPMVRSLTKPSARQGVPTYIFSNNISTITQAEAEEHEEQWFSYPDNDLRFTWKAGDFRAALAPFLTYDLIGPSFNWLLYGDDDTVFFAHGTAQLLSHFDASLPYIITGAALSLCAIPLRL